MLQNIILLYGIIIIDYYFDDAMQRARRRRICIPANEYNSGVAPETRFQDAFVRIKELLN